MDDGRSPIKCWRYRQVPESSSGTEKNWDKNDEKLALTCFLRSQDYITHLQLVTWYKSWFSASPSICSKCHGLCLNIFHQRWLHFQLCECSGTVRQRLCGKLPNADLCPDGQRVKQGSIMPSQWAISGSPITIFYMLVYEPPCFTVRFIIIQKKPCHFCDGGNNFQGNAIVPNSTPQHVVGSIGVGTTNQYTTELKSLSR